VLTIGLLKLVAAIMPLRAESTDEALGMDVSQHGEEAYAAGEGAILVLPEREPMLAATLQPTTEGGHV
jgi:ammonium transporter, Amt family